jgi:hypothetical protein
MPHQFRAETPRERLKVYRLAIAGGLIDGLPEGVKVISRCYTRWQDQELRGLPMRLCLRQQQREDRRWRLVRAKVPPGPCHYCGKPDARDVDHVIPQVQGGTDDLSNLVRCCGSCNRAKAGRTPEQWQRGDSVALFWRSTAIPADLAS